MLIGVDGKRLAALPNGAFDPNETQSGCRTPVPPCLKVITRTDRTAEPVLSWFITPREGHMNRRKFTALLVAASLARSKLALALQVQKVPIIGFLHPGFSDPGSPVFNALREGLRDDGHVEGATVKVEARWALGKPEIFPQLTQELIELGAALVAVARPSIEAARAATTELRIVANDLESDPVAVLLLCAGLALIAAQGGPMIQASI